MKYRITTKETLNSERQFLRGKKSQILLAIAVCYLSLGVLSVLGQNAIDLGQKVIELGGVDNVKSQNKGLSEIMMIKSDNPSIATGHKHGTDGVEILPHTLGETTIEFWDNAEQKLYQILVRVVTQGSNPPTASETGVDAPLIDQNVVGAPERLEFQNGNYQINFKNKYGQVVWQKLYNHRKVLIHSNNVLRAYDNGQTAEGKGEYFKDFFDDKAVQQTFYQDIIYQRNGKIIRTIETILFKNKTTTLRVFTYQGEDSPVLTEIINIDEYGNEFRREEQSDFNPKNYPNTLIVSEKGKTTTYERNAKGEWQAVEAGNNRVTSNDEKGDFETVKFKGGSKEVYKNAKGQAIITRVWLDNYEEGIAGMIVTNWHHKGHQANMSFNDYKRNFYYRIYYDTNGKPIVIVVDKGNGYKPLDKKDEKIVENWLLIDSY